MTPERWQQIKQVFSEAAAREEFERASYLDRACRGDSELRTEVESLLESEKADVSVVDSDLFSLFGKLLARAPGEDRAGLRLGNYRILGEIGRGGMAVVYAAERADDEFRQEVAIKLVRRGMDTEVMVARFRQERQILANLDHPHIAKLLDGGVTREGLPYLVMEKIDGEPIDAFCDQRNLPAKKRLELFRTVCQAVQFAHRSLVVHRDLKPSNILVTSDGQPKLLDFGIAKLIERDPEGGEAELTVEGTRPMTPDYASPEQVLERPVTTASDVYALGVLLYRLLTGRLPYRVGRLSRREIERVVCEEDPERPSAVVEQGPAQDEAPEVATPHELSRRRSTTPKELRRRLRGDLDNIVMRAMRKESERRYPSAEHLAEDVRRYLEGLPVLARENTLAYRAGKFIRRHRIGVAAAALVVLSLVGGIVATTWQARVAQKERLTAQKVSEFLRDLFELSDPEKALGRDIGVRTLLERSAEEIDDLEGEPEVQAALMDTIGRVYLNLGLLDEAESLLEKALAIRREILGKNDPALADSMTHLAALFADRARYEEAARLHRQALDILRRSLPENDARIAQSEVYLAEVLELERRFAEAEAFLRQALDRQRRALGEEHEMVALTLNNLALALSGKSEYQEAVELYRRALEMHRNLLGDDHPEVAVSLNNLASALCKLGEQDEARELFAEAEALERRVLPEEHWSRAYTWNNLAVCLLSQGDQEGAEKLYRASYDLWQSTLGADHPYVAASLSNLGRLLARRGERAEAERYFRRAIGIYSQVSGGRHIDKTRPLNYLALLLQRSGRLDEAESLYREALEIQRRHYGGVHERIARTLNNLGEVVRLRGETGQAVRHFRDAIEMHTRLFGEEHLEGARFHLNLAHALFGGDRFMEAEKAYRKAWDVRRKLRGADHRDVAIAAVGLGRALTESDRPGEALPVLREALEIWLDQPPDQRQPGLAVAQSALGRCLTLLRETREAEVLLEESRASLQNVLGRDHRLTREAERWLTELPHHE